ncbi:MAG: uracil-DNA glycosylase [Nocardioidaceae bacterium]
MTGQCFSSPVPPGTGWPDDVASSSTVTATDRGEVAKLAAEPRGLGGLGGTISVCRACARLVAWREEVAVTRRRAYEAEPYWGRPVPGWGSARPRLVIIGLAPAAHGGNRTGRIFTGDRSGDWLFASLQRTGWAAKPTSMHAGDGQRLIHARMVAAVRCAPPANKPTVEERDTCSAWLDAELAMVAPFMRVAVCLGSYAWDAALRALRTVGYDVPRPRPRFGHGAEVLLSAPSGVLAGAAGRLLLLGSYHPSQQNTFTGKLTGPMLDAVFARARETSQSFD